MMTQTKLISIGVAFMILLSTVIILAVYIDVEGPSIYQIDVLPVEPAEGDTISVTAYAIDPSGVSNFQLSYTLDGLNWETQDMDFIACLCAAGGRWVGSFGPINVENDATFFVTAYDDSLRLNPTNSQMLSVEISA